MPRPRRRPTALLACLAAVLALAVPPAAAAPAPVPEPLPSGPQARVTLVTGDTVTLGAPVGGVPTVSVRSDEGPGAATSYATLRRDGDVYVVPGEAVRLVPDVLDLELFNVTALVEMGYSDAETGSIPLIVQGPRPLAAVPSAQATRSLESIGATVVRLSKDRAGEFASALAAAPVPLKAGVRKVWLDARFRAAELDANLRQIGAPRLWESGLSGSGVDVAVLDTGVDDTHPDLAGRVHAEENFTTDGSAADRNGHGTHVASIIGGSGAAADGSRRGVAFGARLLSGKVLDHTGNGQASWVIAGMEWAVEHGAEIVNLSLGAPAGEQDGPVVRALDALTASSGTLFVAAAGNGGWRDFTINTPGTAASALTVGAARPDGNVAPFSSRGPTSGSYRSKPDLTAPGVGIMGARAGGGTADPYVAMDGTSQATPHVAGAAALLLERHPGWSSRQLKSALVNTADSRLPTPTPRWEGAGLLDAAQAATEPLRVDLPAVDLGVLRYPEGTEPVRTVITLTNTGTVAQEVALRDEVRRFDTACVCDEPVPDGLVTVEPATVRVPPGGGRKVTVTVTPELGAPGRHGGGITLSRDGREDLVLPLNFYAEPPRHDLDLTVLDRHGEPYANGRIWVGNMETINRGTGGGFAIVPLDENGRGSVRMAPGPLSIMAWIDTPARDGEPSTMSLAGSPEVLLTSDRSFTVDAQKAQRLEPATVSGAETRVDAVTIVYGQRDAGRTGAIGAGYRPTPEEVRDGRVFLQPTEPVEHGTAAVNTQWRLETIGEPRGRQADVYDLLLGGPAVPGPPTYAVSKKDVRDLVRLENDYRPLAAPGTYREWREAVTEVARPGIFFERPLRVPQQRVELVTPGRWQQCVDPVSVVENLCGPVETYAPGERRSPVWFRAPTPAVTGARHGPDFLSLPLALTDGVHQGRVSDFTSLGTESLRLWRNGVEQEPYFPGSSFFRTGNEPATFRLEHSARPDRDLLPIGRKVHTSWTFPSHGSQDPWELAEVPRLLSLDFRPRTDERNRLSPWLPLVMPVRMVTAPGFGDAVRLERGSLRLWVSTDHGRRWREALVLPMRDGTFLTIAPLLWLPSGSTVSVRAEGRAAEGRTIEQTVLDAYRVR